MTRAEYQLFTISTLPAFTGATQWLNSEPLTPGDLNGKVVLVNFWTYTCINWLRTLPYIRAWAEKYNDQGLVVIGVHTPEFAFEHNIDNVQHAIESRRITYPVAVDNRYAIWSAFDNHFWPALYFADAQGRIRYHQFGEGEYEMAERAIQQLLTETGAKNVGADLVRVEPQGAEVAADWQSLESPETYLGYERTANFASPSGIALGRHHTYNTPKSLRVNEWALSGNWTIEAQVIVLNVAGGKITYRFHARDVNLVMGPIMRGAPVPFHVRIDGEPPYDAHGVDIDAEGSGATVDQRLYQLIRQPEPITDHQFEIEFFNPGIQALSFTFG